MTLPDITMNLTGDGTDLAASRSDFDIWILIAGMMLFLVLTLWATGITIDFASHPVLLGIALCYTLVTCFYTFLRKVPEIADALIIFGQLLLIMMTGLLLTYAVSAIPLPYRDAELHALDVWIGFNRAAFLKFLTDHPILLSFVYVGYTSILPQFVVAPFALVLSSHIEHCRTYLVAYGLSLTITCFIAAFVPAIDAVLHVDLPAAGYGELSPHFESHFPTLMALRDGVLSHIPLHGFEGLITFPSFHTVSAVLFMWAFWPLRLVRPFAVALNLLMIIGTPGFGAHYFVDVLAGLIVAFLSIIAANYIRSRVKALPSVCKRSESTHSRAS